MPKWQQLKSKKHTLFYTLQNGQKETKMEQKKRRSQTTVIYIYIICCGCCWLVRKIWWKGKTGETHTFCINLKCVCLCVCTEKMRKLQDFFSLICTHLKRDKSWNYIQRKKKVNWTLPVVRQPLQCSVVFFCQGRNCCISSQFFSCCSASHQTFSATALSFWDIVNGKKLWSLWAAIDTVCIPFFLSTSAKFFLFCMFVQCRLYSAVQCVASLFAFYVN